jgi:hypothetical protein
MALCTNALGTLLCGESNVGPAVVSGVWVSP